MNEQVQVKQEDPCNNGMYFINNHKSGLGFS
jgi:hypothetical protein